MSKFDQLILKRNIKKLLTNKNMTQEKLASILGMSQSNVSKALSEKDSKCFTVEQLFNIAEHFNVSIDHLLGREDVKSGITEGPRAVCEFLADLIDKHEVRWTSLTVDEVSYSYNQYSESLEPQNRISEYTAFYFPNYLDPHDGLRTFEESSQLSEVVRELGNRSSSNPSINLFIQKYIDFLPFYKKGQLSEEVYTGALKEFLSALDEKWPHNLVGFPF